MVESNRSDNSNEIPEESDAGSVHKWFDGFTSLKTKAS